MCRTLTSKCVSGLLPNGDICLSHLLILRLVNVQATHIYDGGEMTVRNVTCDVLFVWGICLSLIKNIYA